MDPNETLRMLRQAIHDWSKGRYDSDLAMADVMLYFDGLDEWLTKGGFLPDAWAPENNS